MTTPVRPPDSGRAGNAGLLAKIAVLAALTATIVTVTVKQVAPPPASCVGLTVWQLFPLPARDTASVGAIGDTIYVTPVSDFTYVFDSVTKKLSYAWSPSQPATGWASVCLPSVDSLQVIRLVPSLPPGASSAGVTLLPLSP